MKLIMAIGYERASHRMSVSLDQILKFDNLYGNKNSVEVI